MTAAEPGPASAEADDLWACAAEEFSRWRAGDPEALEELVARMTPVLWHVVRAYRLPSEVAEDVVQATWLALVRRRDQIADPAAVGRWLTVTARRAAWRISAHAARDHSVDPTDLEPLAPAERSAESQAVESDERSRLWQAVAALDERCQRLLRVVAFSPRPDYAALSGTLGMPVGSIGPTRGRCLAKLRAALGDSFTTGGR